MKQPDPLPKAAQPPEPKAPDLVAPPPAAPPPTGGSVLPPLSKDRGEKDVPAPPAPSAVAPKTALPPAVPAPDERPKAVPAAVEQPLPDHSRWVDKEPAASGVKITGAAATTGKEPPIAGGPGAAARDGGGKVSPASPLEPIAAPAEPPPPAPRPVASPASGGLWSKPAADATPAVEPAPLGSEPRAVTPPVKIFPPDVPTRPLTVGAGAVERYEESSRQIRASDIGPRDADGRPVDAFAKLSKEFYQTEDYGDALRRWNVDHPRASEAMRLEGRLVAGDRLFVPPVAMLEKRYGAFIPERAKAGASAVPAGAASGVVPASAAQPVQPLPPPVTAPPPVPR